MEALALLQVRQVLVYVHNFSNFSKLMLLRLHHLTIKTPYLVAVSAGIESLERSLPDLNTTEY